jgi:outer membrane protein, heavy metal efflux system
MNYKLSITILLLFFSTAAGQPVDSLIQEAYRNNPQLKSFEFQMQASDYRASSVGAWPAPTLGVELSQFPKLSSNVWNDALSNNFSLSQMFMVGGKLSAMSEMEKRKGKVVEQNLGSFQVQLRAKIKMNYYQLWLLDRQIEVQHQTLSILNDLAQTMQPHAITNRMRQADLYSLQAEVASEKAKLNELSAQRINLQNVINFLLGRNDFAQIIKTDSVFIRPSSDLSEPELIKKVRQNNPQLKTMDQMKEMNEAEITVTNRELYPDIMLQAMVMRMPNGMILTGGPRSSEMIQQLAAGMPMQKTDWMYSIMASITLPFAPWSSSRLTAKADEMRATNMSIDAEKDAMQREMIASLRSAITKYNTADFLIRQYRSEILPLTHQSAEAQTVAYQTGQVPITTLLDSRRMELMKQDDYFMVLMNRQMAIIEIEMMVGAPLQ